MNPDLSKAISMARNGEINRRQRIDRKVCGGFVEHQRAGNRVRLGPRLVKSH